MVCWRLAPGPSVKRLFAVCVYAAPEDESFSRWCVSPRRGPALALVATVQFLLVLDITIVTVALPTTQRELGVEQVELQWLVTAYALTFGGFLLLAGRVADLFGRRRMFVVGVLLFGAASLAAGLAVNELMLVVARGVRALRRSPC